MPRPDRVVRLAPSLLSADFADLAAAMRAAEEGGADAFHLDVMDGHFVPNITFGPALVRAVRARTDRPLDLHLMVEHPERFVKPFADAGGDMLVFHVEATDRPEAVIEAIRATGRAVGMALRPDTLLERVLPHLEALDELVVMTVVPGFSGQAFRHDVVPKLREAGRAIDRSARTVELAVDGGVTVETAPVCVEAGASFLVCGNSVFAGGPIVQNLADLRRASARGTRDPVP